MERGHESFCAIYWFILDYINFSKFELCLTQWFPCLGLCRDTVDICIFTTCKTSWDSSWLILCYRGNQFTVSQVMSLLCKTTFYANGHAQLCQLCHVIQSYMLNVYHSPAHYFILFTFPQAQCHLQTLSQLKQSPVPLYLPLPGVVIATHATHNHWAFYFQGSGVPICCCQTGSSSMCMVHIALQELSLLCTCCVK